MREIGVHELKAKTSEIMRNGADDVPTTSSLIEGDPLAYCRHWKIRG
jgi:hypothetical protein